MNTNPYFFDAIEFEHEQDLFLSQRLRKETVHSTPLFQLLGCPQQALEQTISQIAPRFSFFTGNLSQQSKRFYMFRLFAKLNKWSPKNIADETTLSYNLFILQEALCPTAFRECQVLVYLLSKVSRQAAIELMERKFISQWFVLKREEQNKTLLWTIETFLKNYYNDIMSISQKKDESKLATEQLILIAKIIKLYSWIFYQQPLEHFNISLLYSCIPHRLSSNLLAEIIQIKHQETQKLISTILQQCEDANKQLIEPNLPTPIPQELLSDQLLDIIFATSFKPHNFLKTESIDPSLKSVVFKYNILNLSQRALFNIVPYVLQQDSSNQFDGFLHGGPNKEHQLIMSHIITLHLQILLVLQDLEQRCYSALSYECGRAKLIKLGQGQKRRLLQLFLLMEQIFLKVMDTIKRKHQRNASISFNFIDKRPGSIKKYAEILNLFCGLQSLEAMNTLCSLMIKLEDSNLRYVANVLKKQPFFSKLLNKVLQALSQIKPEVLPTIKDILHFISKFQKNIIELGLLNQDLPFNNPNIYEFAYHNDLVSDQSSRLSKVTNFAGIGRYYRDESCHFFELVNPKDYAKLFSFVVSELPSLLSSVSLEAQQHLTKVEVSKLVLALKVLFAEGTKLQGKEQMLRMVKKVAESKILPQQIYTVCSFDDLLSILQLDLFSQLSATTRELLNFLEQETIYYIPIHSQFIGLKDLPKEIEVLQKMLIKLNFLLEVALLSPEVQSKAFVETLQLMGKLRRLTLCWDEEVQLFLNEQSIQILEELQILRTKLASILVDKQIRHIYQLIQTVNQNSIKILAKSTAQSTVLIFSSLESLLARSLQGRTFTLQGGYLKVLNQIVSNLNESDLNQHHVTLLFFMRYKQLMMILAKRLYLKTLQYKLIPYPEQLYIAKQNIFEKMLVRVTILKKRNINSWKYYAGQLQINCFQDLKEFICELICIPVRTSKKVYINDEIHHGAQNIYLIEKSLLNMLLNQFQSQLNPELLSLQTQTIVRLCKNINIGYIYQSFKEPSVGIHLEGNRLQILQKEGSQDILNCSKLSTIQRLLRHNDMLSRQETIEIITTLWTTVSRKVGTNQMQQFAKQVANWMELIMAQQILNRSHFIQGIQLLTTFLSKMTNAKNSLAINFINKFIKSLSILLEQKVQGLQSALYLFEKLIPYPSEGKLPEKALKFTKYIIQLIEKIPDIPSQKDKQQAAYGFIVRKLLEIKQAELQDRLSFFFTKIDSKFIPDIICSSLKRDTLLLQIELQIKSFFLKQSQQSRSKKFRGPLKDLAVLLQKKFEENISQVTKMLASLSRKSDSEGEIEVVYTGEESLSFSRVINAQFTSWKPSYLFRQYLHSKIQDLTDNPSKQGIITSLFKIIKNFPLALPYILFHPVPNQKQSIIFLDFIIQKEVEVANNELRLFLIVACSDHNVVIKAKDHPILLADYACLHIVQRLLGSRPGSGMNVFASQPDNFSEVNRKCLVLTNLLCLLSRFAKFCHLKLSQSAGSLATVIEKKLIQHPELTRASLVAKLNCALTLVLLHRNYTYQKLRQIAQTKNLCQISDTAFEVSSLTFEDIKTQLSPEEKLRGQDVPVLEGDGLSKDIYGEQIQSLFNEAYNLNPIPSEPAQYTEIDEEFKEFLVPSNKPINIYPYCRQRAVISQVPFNMIIFYLQKYSQTASYKFDLSKLLGFQSRFNQEQQLNNRQEESGGQLIAERLEASRYAASDFTGSYISTGVGCPRLSSFYQQLMENIPLLSKKDTIQSQKKQQILEIYQLTNQFTQNEEIKKLIHSINTIRKALELQKFEDKTLNFKTEEEAVDYLKRVEANLEFDLKQQTLSHQQFEQYCLANMMKFSRLSSERMAKVEEIQEYMFQRYVRRTTSSDSVDYIIDTIDHNYELLHNKSSDHLNKKTEQRKYEWRQLRSTQLPLEVFPDIHEQVLFQLISLFYYQIGNFKYENFIPVLQNKRLQAKIVNTLLFILRNPFENGIFPNQMLDIQNLNPVINPNSTLLIQKRIIQFISCCYDYSFYKDDQFLLEATDGRGIRGIELQPYSVTDSIQGKYNEKPIYEFIQFALDDKFTETSNAVKLKLLKGLSDVPTRTLDRIFEFIVCLSNSLDAQQSHQERFKWIEVKEQLKIQQSLESLSKYEPFRNKIYNFSPPQNPTLNGCLLGSLIHLGIYSQEEIRVIHQKLLQKKTNRSGEINFFNQVLKHYTDQELQACTWVKQYFETYSLVIHHYTLQSKKIQAEHCYRLLPFMLSLLPFQTRLKIFQSEIQGLRKQARIQNSSSTIYSHRKKGIFESAFEELRHKTGSFWLGKIQTRFINELGEIESGYGTGVEKDWYTLITKGMVNLNYSLFSKNQKNYYFFSRESWINPRHLQFFEFIGKLVALSIIKDHFFLSPSFSLVFYKIILGKTVTVADLMDEFDEGQVLSNLEKLRTFTDDSMFWQTFVYEDVRLLNEKRIDHIKELHTHSKDLYLVKQAETLKQPGEDADALERTIKYFKVGEMIELLPGGKDIPVTLQNVQQYITLTKQKILQKVISSVDKQIKAFLEGFSKVINPKLLQKFTPEELRQIAEGSNQIESDKLKEHINYNGYNEDDEQVKLFWGIFDTLSPQDKTYLIQHWTGTPKLPVQGIADMNLTIVKKNTNDKRMFAQTCFNSLSVPAFESEEEMRQSMMTAINAVKLGLSILEDQ